MKTTTRSLTVFDWLFAFTLGMAWALTRRPEPAIGPNEVDRLLSWLTSHDAMTMLSYWETLADYEEEAKK